MSTEVRNIEAGVSAPGRVVFIDVLRLLAAFQMVQGHTLDAVLAASLRHGAWFELWQRARGLTAVSFLFAAGLAFHATTLTRFERYRAAPEQAARRRFKALRLIALGYLLHAPLALLFVDDPASRARVLRDFLSVDVLQCIGVSLLTLEFLVKRLPSARYVAIAAGLLGISVMIAAPWAHVLAVDGPWFLLLGFVSAQGGSIFPLLPWAGHLWLGVAIAHWAQPAWTSRLCVAGLGLSCASWWIERIGGHELLVTHVGRLGAVTLICAGLSASFAQRRRLGSWLEALTGQTLAIYVFHILLVYGAGVGLGPLFGPTLQLPAASLLTLVVMLASVAVALGFQRFVVRRALAAPAGKR